MLNPGVPDIPTQALVLGAAFVLCSIAGTTLAATNKAKLCFKGSEAEPSGNITLACPESQVIAIDEALFGRSKWLLCVISDGDCVDKTKIFQECENRNNCTRSFKTYSTKCGYASVMFISYTCLLVDPVSVYTPNNATVLTTKKADISGGLQAHGTGKSGLVNKESGSSLNETGLIAGCVVAAVVTVIFLVIAITMVVRRLTQKNNPDDDDDAEADTTESKQPTHCVCLNCFSHIKNCFSYHKNTQDFKTAKMTDDVSSPTNKQNFANHRLTAEVMGNSLTSEDPKGQMSSDDRMINTQSDAEDDQLDSNFNSRLKHTIKENADQNIGGENSPLVTGVHNEINSMNKQQNNTGSDNSFSNMAEDAQEENNISHKRKQNSTGACISEGQQMPADDHKQTHPAKHPTYDAVSIPNTEKGTIC